MDCMNPGFLQLLLKQIALNTYTFNRKYVENVELKKLNIKNFRDNCYVIRY
jgi:hypothetical protein